MRLLFAAFAILLSCSAWSETSYLALYMSGAKIGYSSYSAAAVKLNGKPASRNDSTMVMDIGLLGTPVKMKMDSSTWSSAGKPVKMTFHLESAGRQQDVVANFTGSTVNVLINNSGQKTTRTLKMPPGEVVDDPVALMLQGKMKPGAKKSFYVLDPMTIKFLKNEVRLVGKAKTKVNGRSYDAVLLEVDDTRTVTKIFTSAKGDLIKIESLMGIEMLPVSKAIALAPPGKYAPSVDLAYSTSLKTDKAIVDPASLTGLTVRVTAKNLKRIPNDGFQTTTNEGGSWIIEVHPPQLGAAESASVVEAARQKPDWVKPSLHMPSDAKKFKDLAVQIVGDRQDVKSAALAVQRWVNQEMKPNAGIGVLRDATEVVQTKEGVCRDYAILTVTLLRAARIPARLASGIVNWDGAFYYHAWAEAWDGSRWLGIDSTTDREQISAAHVKLGEGNVEEAFTFTFLDRAKIEVLKTKRE
ncbi:MAG TPA: transglutaminase-like domain-containing protein [Fimbriimonas sp.]|nr:transglutaminase-like domain-containing protein [Fimbriimonas sp.]